MISIEFFSAPFLMGLGLMVVVGILLWRRNCGGAFIFLFTLFWIYLLFLIGATLFPLPIPLDMGGSLPRRPIGEILERIAYIPFQNSHLFSLYPTAISFELVGNILLTLPFGFGLRFIARIRAQNILWLAFGLGLAIEASQLLVSLVVGLAYRGVDITDVILNAAGVLAGYALFRVFAWIYQVVIRKFRIQPKGFIEYITQVTRWPGKG